MNLTLEIISANGAALGADRLKVFGSEGGRIGRASDCDWVLPSAKKYVSRHHATIQYANGVFYIKAQGNNAVGINDPANLLASGKLTPLRQGDRLFIDEYEIFASIVILASVPAQDDNPFAEPGAQPLGMTGGSGDGLDPLSLLPGSPRGKPRVESYVGTIPGSILSDAFVPPRGVSTARVSNKVPGGIPTDPNAWDQPDAEASSNSNASVVPSNWLADDSHTQTSTPPFSTTKPASVPRDAGVDLDAVLRAAGVDPLSVSPEVARSLGVVLRVVVQGTIDTLRARDEVKSQFRLAVTRVRASENNPLTFAIDADDALNSLLKPRNTAFFGPVEAFQRAFDDISAHQMGMLSGMRAGFESLMSRLDPEHLQDMFDKQAKRGGLLAAVVKPSYWELYRSYFADLKSDRDDAFRRLFGEEFALAYEKQIALLKHSRRQKS